jgi:hypothetical protein
MKHSISPASPLRPLLRPLARSRSLVAPNLNHTVRRTNLPALPPTRRPPPPTAPPSRTRRPQVARPRDARGPELPARKHELAVQRAPQQRGAVAAGAGPTLRVTGAGDDEERRMSRWRWRAHAHAVERDDGCSEMVTATSAPRSPSDRGDQARVRSQPEADVLGRDGEAAECYSRRRFDCGCDGLLCVV